MLVGLFTIAVGVGPRTALDIGYHIAMLAVLLAGLAISVRGRPVSTASSREWAPIARSRARLWILTSLEVAYLRAL